MGHYMNVVVFSSKNTDGSLSAPHSKVGLSGTQPERRSFLSKARRMPKADVAGSGLAASTGKGFAAASAR